MNLSNSRLRFFSLAALLFSTQSALPLDDMSSLTTAIAELKGSLITRFDAIEKRISDVETYSKASYGQIKGMVDELAAQKDIQLRAVEAVTGKRDINALLPAKVSAPAQAQPAATSPAVASS